MQLAGKKAIVTGAAQGIGRAIALAYAREGADVAVVDIKKEKAEAVAREVQELGRQSLAVACDVSDPDQVAAMVDQVLGAWGGVDILVNNAGILQYKPMLDMSYGEWRKTQEVNVDSMFLVTRLVVPAMIRAGKGGRIINTASVLSERGAERYVDYCASKGAVAQFTRALAIELGDYGITVNAIGPGPTDTEINAGVYTDEVVKELTGRMAIKRVAAPEEIAPAAVFFATDAAQFITGQLLFVDGGYSLF